MWWRQVLRLVLLGVFPSRGLEQLELGLHDPVSFIENPLAKLPCDSDEAGICLISKPHGPNSGSDFIGYYNGSIVFDGRDAKINVPGDVNLKAEGAISLTGGAELQAQHDVVLMSSTGGYSVFNSSIAAGGAVRCSANGTDGTFELNEGSLSAGSDVTLSADYISLLHCSSITASGTVQLLGKSDAGGKEVAIGKDNFGCKDASGDDRGSYVQGSDLAIFCMQGDFLMGEQAVLCSQGNVHLSAKEVNVNFRAMIGAKSIDIAASGNVNINATAMPGVIKSDPPYYTKVNVTSTGTVSLGAADQAAGPWTVSGLIVVAKQVVFQELTVSTDAKKRNSCKNKPASPDFWRSRCHDTLYQWKDDLEYLQDFSGTVGGTEKLTFDLGIIAESMITANKATVHAASIWFCSNVVALVNASIRADARGCPAGRGQGGQAEVSQETVSCGAAGGAHSGKAGSGGQVISGQYKVTTCPFCPCGNDAYDTPVLAEGLPTAGASGGGCGTPQKVWYDSCEALNRDQPIQRSAGGGLVLLAAMTFVVEGKVALNANGGSGVSWQYQVPGTHPASAISAVSGGGAGGTVIIILVSFSLKGDKTSVTITANGGEGSCNDVAGYVSGGGSGGYIGVQWLKSVPKLEDSVEARLFANATGGGHSKCDSKIPQDLSSGNPVSGRDGIISSPQCTKGQYGLLCSSCDVGTYSSDALSCQPCTNKPENGIYTTAGWPNATCDYKCMPGVPIRKGNPDCYGTITYAFYMFGGWQGVITIASFFVLIVAFLLCRPGAKERRQNRARQIRRCIAALPGRVCSFCPCCQRRLQHAVQNHQQLPAWLRRVSGQSDGPAEPLNPVSANVQQFTKEQLPYHVGRVYLAGENRRNCPWQLSRKVPSQFANLLLEEAWLPFADEVQQLTKHKKFELFFAAVLRAIHPGMLLPYNLYWRRRKAEAIRRRTQYYSEGSNGRRALWHPLHGSVGHGQLVAIFGFDEGATLGYIDFVDFSRNPMNWAPLDLHWEARVLVAHGHGSYEQPYALNIEDPLVQHLCQSGFGAPQIAGLVSTFNRMSRLLKAVDLEKGTRSANLLLANLREKVEQCAECCGLAECVRVVAMNIPLERERPTVMMAASGTMTSASFSDLQARDPRFHNWSEALDRDFEARARTPIRQEMSDVKVRTLRDMSPGGRSPRRTPPSSRSPRSTAAAAAAASVRSQLEAPPTRRDSQRHSTYSGFQGPETGSMRTHLRLGLAFANCSYLPASRVQCSAPSLPLGASVSSSQMRPKHGDSGQRLSADDPWVVSNSSTPPSVSSFTPANRQPSSILPSSRMPVAAPVFDAAVTSPMPAASLQEHLLWMWPEPGDEPEFSFTWAYARSFVWRDKLNLVPTTLLVLLVLALMTDVLLVILYSRLLTLGHATIGFALFNLIPPFSQPTCIAMGALFLLTDAPWFGRVVAQLQCWSLLGVVASILWSLWQSADAWIFDVCAILIFIIVKIMVFIVVHMRVACAERDEDLAFAEAPQIDFLGQILAQGSACSPSEMDPGGAADAEPTDSWALAPRERRSAGQLAVPDASWAASRPIPRVNRGGSIGGERSWMTQDMRQQDYSDSDDSEEGGDDDGDVPELELGAEGARGNMYIMDRPRTRHTKEPEHEPSPF
eukprot:TRINITY_DN5255_c0_g1_i1.p1 TRINITY_DN5255_c0_g1~~TRINITY_DN5255_c0_g1_i1.p1  ORF type:complete len:1636 (+),score=242.31 TRINITY_DN5255_c0_g1_i1:127-5034(+)